MAIKVASRRMERRSFGQRLLMFFLGIDRDLAIQSAISFLIVLIFSGVFYLGVFNRAENIFLDLFYRWSPEKAVDHVISIDVKEDALVAIKERPIPLKHFAEFIQIMKEWGARAVVFDFVLEGQMDSDGYLELQKAITSNKNVYIPLFAGKSNGREVLIQSPAELESRARGVGYLNWIPDNDGILRRFEPFIESGGRLYPHLGLEVVYDSLGRKLEAPGDLWSAPQLDGQLMISWPGSWGTAFKHYSFMDVLKSHDRISKNLSPFVEPQYFKDKICMVGYSGIGATSSYATPLEKSVPSKGVIAAVINGALLNDFVKPVGKPIKLAYLFALGLITIICFVPFRAFLSTLAAFGIAFGWVSFSFFMLAFQGVWIFVLHPLILILILLVFSSIFSKYVAERERNVFYQLSTTDGLTGAAVRRYFDLMFKKAFVTAKRFHLPLSVVLMDIDHFKKFNDTYGHQAGDEVLRQVASVIRKGIRFHEGNRKADLLARYGGEEFIMLFPGTELNGAFSIAERVRKAIETIPVEWQGQQLKVTMSLGVACVHDFDEKPELVVKRADDALYRSKEKGRNQTSMESLDEPASSES